VGKGISKGGPHVSAAKKETEHQDSIPEGLSRRNGGTNSLTCRESAAQKVEESSPKSKEECAFGSLTRPITYVFVKKERS